MTIGAMSPHRQHHAAISRCLQFEKVRRQPFHPWYHLCRLLSHHHLKRLPSPRVPHSFFRTTKQKHTHELPQPINGFSHLPPPSSTSKSILQCPLPCLPDCMVVLVGVKIRTVR